MDAINCYLCEQETVTNTLEKSACPVCHQSVCGQHLATVRWKWKATGAVDSAKVCRQCVRTYEHRSWDSYSRDWIT